jgi:hypothetical protein
MDEKKKEERLGKETQKKSKYESPKTVKHDPIEIVSGTCYNPGECSLYYYY